MNLYTYATYAFIPLCFPSSTNTFIDSYFFYIQKIFHIFTVILQIFSVILSIKRAFPSVLRLNMTLGKLIRKIGLDKDNVIQNHKIYAAVFRTPKKSIYGTF